jgi:hypothetical protein
LSREKLKALLLPRIREICTPSMQEDHPSSQPTFGPCVANLKLSDLAPPLDDSWSRHEVKSDRWSILRDDFQVLSPLLLNRSKGGEPTALGYFGVWTPEGPGNILAAPPERFFSLHRNLQLDFNPLCLGIIFCPSRLTHLLHKSRKAAILEGSSLQPLELDQ